MLETLQAALAEQSNAKTIEILYVAFELSRKKWKLGFSDGRSARARVVTIAAQDWEALNRELERARVRFGLSEEVRVVSCYEIGREGFWLHRAMVSRGIENIVVDAASIEVNRRQRRAKTDRIDAEKLVEQLVRYVGGERRVWSVVRVPEEEAEDARQLHRDIGVLTQERGQHRMRIQSLLFMQGLDVKVDSHFLKRLEGLRRWDGRPLPSGLEQRLRREYQRLQAVELDLRQLRKHQEEKLKAEPTPALKKVVMLQQLAGIGMRSSWLFVMELFGWRRFKNRREVAGAVGLTPTPYQSGESDREQGISRSGNRRVRAMAIEIAWCWLKFQPHSELSRWYRRRFGSAGARMRKIGIVALARRLVIELWRYLEQGTVPAGARLKTIC
jgi:transposase